MSKIRELITRCKQVSVMLPIKRIGEAEAELAALEAVAEAAAFFIAQDQDSWEEADAWHELREKVEEYVALKEAGR